MNRLAKTILLTATAAALTLSAIGEASARDRHWRHGHNDAWVGGAVGLATGLIVGSAIANSGPVYEDRRYIDPPYDPAYEPAPVYRAPRRVYVEPDYYPEPERRVIYREAPSYEPWTQSWYRFCSQRYRSFDANTGTYVGYDGREHFCTAG